MNTMFKENYQHHQQSLLESTLVMDKRIKEKLQKTWAPVFYENVFCKIDEKPFAELYGTTGNPNFPVNILLSLEYIKHMKDIPDSELMDDFHFDYLVNYAVGLRTLGEKHLSDRTLYYFRQRIYQYCLDNPDKSDLLFGQFIILLKAFAEKAGIKLEEQRMDTTMFMSNIKKAGRIALAFDVLVKAVKAIPVEIRTEKLSKVLLPDFRTETLFYAKSTESDTKLALILNLCNESLVLLKTVLNNDVSEEIRILERFIKEQSGVDETGKLIPKSKKDITSSSLQSAYDEDATYRKKASVGQSGYVLEIAETCTKSNPFQLITDYAVDPNNTSDVEIIQDRLVAIKDNTSCKDMYVDGGFHSKDVSDAAKENGIKMHLTDMSGTEPTKKMPTTDFKIDEDTNKILQCPNNQTPERAETLSGQTVAHFPHSACDNCEQRENCHTKRQKKNYVVRLSLKAVNAGRERAKIQEFKKENTSMRAAIEGSNSALKRKGLRKLKVRGKAKCTVVCGLKVAAQNIRRFTKFMLGGYKSKVSNIGIVIPIPA